MNCAIIDRTVSCPYCGESSIITLDLSAGEQSYVEDCQVCCQPMQISFEVDDGNCVNLGVGRAV